MAQKELKQVWVDAGGDGFPMSVIDEHPNTWQDKITGSRVAVEHRHRFKPFVAVPDCNGGWDFKTQRHMIVIAATERAD